MYFFSIVNAMKKESEINFHSVFVIILHLSVVLGLIHEWGFFLGIEIWTLWFIIHLIIWSIYVIYIETLIEVNETIKTHMLYHSFVYFLMVLPTNLCFKLSKFAKLRSWLQKRFVSRHFFYNFNNFIGVI